MMEKIEFYHSIFTPEETNAMANQMVLVLESSRYTDENLKLAKGALEGENLNLTKILNSSKSNPFTDPLNDADEYRDECFRGGRDVIDGMTHWVFDVEKQEAAKRLKKIIERHGWRLNSYPYQDQTSATLSLIEELKLKKNQQDLETVGLMVWFNALVESQNEFEIVYNKMTGYKGNKEPAKKREAQVPVNNAIEKLVICVNSIVLFGEKGNGRKKLYNAIEGIVAETTTRARARRSNRNNKNDKEE